LNIRGLWLASEKRVENIHGNDKQDDTERDHFPRAATQGSAAMRHRNFIITTISAVVVTASVLRAIIYLLDDGIYGSVVFVIGHVLYRGLMFSL
jgi:hypothetical protein